jgi:hypothetical protein
MKSQYPFFSYSSAEFVGEERPSGERCVVIERLLTGPAPCLEVRIEPRANGRAICSKCGKPRPGYDRLAARRFEFVPLWYIAVFFVYAIRRWCLLKRPENLTEAQATKLATLLRYHLRSVKAHLLREAFQRFGEYTNPATAGKFRDEWTAEAIRSRLDPMKKVVRSLRRHRHLIVNWFRAGVTISAGVVEGINGKAKLTTREAFGFRTPQASTSPCFTSSAAYRNPTSPTDCAEEATSYKPIAL